MSRIILQKKDGALAATDEESVTALAHIKEGTEVFAEISQARNPERHRKFMLLASIVAESMDKTTDVVREHALKVLGYVDTYLDFDDRLVIKAKSMRFVGGMSEAEFVSFMDKAVNLMANWISADHKDLLRRYNEVASDKRYEGMRHG